MTPSPGDFGLVSISGIAGFGIRLGQWLNGGGFGKFEHAFIVVNGDRLIEAEPGGARWNNLTAYAGTNVMYSDWDLTDEQRAAVVQAAGTLIDTPYSWLDYMSLVLRRFHIPAPHLRGYIANTRHMICSQLVDHVYLLAGLHMFSDDRWPGDVTPADLVAVLHGPQGDES